MTERLNKKSDRSDIRLNDNGVDITDDEGVANVLNRHFKTKIEMLREKIDPTQKKDPMGPLKKKKFNTSFHLQAVTEQDVQNKIRLLKKKSSCGPDQISATVLKDACYVLSAPLTSIINMSIKNGSFPTAWKTAKVIPLLKKGSPEDKSNYRPVALLSVVSKILEMVIKDQLADYFEKNNLLPQGQHGFRKKRSTSSALFSVCGWISSRRQHKFEVAMAAYDLTAAFDSIDAEILDKKLEHYGLDDSARNWVRSFLSERRQYVNVGQSSSICLDMTVGTPQGSVLSPLIFIIYVADIDLWVSNKSVAISSYADDTAAAASGATKEEAIQNLEQVSKELLHFFASNMLVANPTKTALLVIRSPRDTEPRLNMNVGGVTIEESENISLLGIKIQSDFSWDCQCQAVLSSLRSTNGLLSRLSKFVPNRCLTPLIHGLLLSKIRYAFPLFADVRTEENDVASSSMRRIQIEMNRGLRTVLGKSLKDRIPIAELLNEVQVPSANQLAIETTLTEVWRQIRNGLPAGEYFNKLDNISARATRRTGKNYLTPPPMERSGAGKFIEQGTMLWNMAPQEVRDGEDNNCTKRMIKEFARSMPI